MKKLTIPWMAAAVFLAGCGGGGGPNVDNGQAFAPSAPRIDILPQQVSLPANTSQFPPEVMSPYLTPVSVRVLRADGSPIPDGVIVSLRSNDSRSVSLSAVTNQGSIFATSDSFCAQTSGSLASFLLHSGPQAGTVQLTASVTFPPEPGTVSDNPTTGVRVCTIPFTQGVSTSYFGTLNYTVTPGVAPFDRLTVTPARTTLLANLSGTPVTPVSPFVVPVEITARTLAGELISLPGFTVEVSTSSPIALLSVADDPATADVNEFLALFRSAAVPIVSGRATVYVHSTSQPGNVSVVATLRDPQSGVAVTRQAALTVTGSSSNAPSSVRITDDDRPLYVRGVNGNNDMPLQVSILDASGQPAADSSSANLLLEILPVANGSGEVLAAQGVPDGSSVRLRTVGGSALATFRSGTRSGSVAIRATADRADNNIDNGIQNPVISQTSFFVSDGQLFEVRLTSPIINAVRINGVDPNAEPVDFDIGDDETIEIPPDPDGTYALTVSAIGLDRRGQPVAPNTEIEFGVIDSPLEGGSNGVDQGFALSGNDGNPQEAGNVFTAQTGAFTTAGGGAGPGDTLLVFAKEIAGNRDLESARTITAVTGPTTLTIQNRFNRNDDTGAIVDNGGVLPYVIGRATAGNIGPNARTRAADGVATVRLTYPTSQLGRLAAVWARGVGETVNGSPELVTDAGLIRYPGVAPGRLSASPVVIPANIVSVVQVCYTDALLSGISGIRPSFAVLGSNQATVDGVAGSGQVANATNQSGCVLTQVNAIGVVGPGTTIRFSVGGATAVVTVAPPNTPVLQAIPGALGGQGGTVLLRLLDGNGTPIPGILISGTCSGGGDVPITLFQLPGVTNAQGQTTAGISAQLDGVGSVSSGTCTFTAANGPSVTVPLQGIDLCDTPFSPRPAGCPAGNQPTGTFVVNAIGLNGAVGVVVVAPGPLNIPTPNGSDSTIQPVGTAFNLTASPDPLQPAPNVSRFCYWQGGTGCSGQTTQVLTVTLDTTGTKNCQAIFAPVGTCPTP